MRTIGLASLTLLLVACPEQAKTPTTDTIAGVWIEQCQTKSRDTTSCSASSDMPFRFDFRPGGKFSKTFDGFDACSTSSWTLRGTTLEFVCKGGDLTLHESWQAQIVGGRLILWDDELGGRVLVREGTLPSGDKNALSAPTDVTRTLGEVTYTVRLPKGYFVGEETTVSDEFVSETPSALRFRFKVGHSARPVGERARCDDAPRRTSRDDDGAIRMICIDNSAGVFTVSCWAQRTDKGPLTDEQFASAEEVCDSLTGR